MQHLIRNEILAGAVALHNRRHHILRHVLIVGQQLFRVFRQAIAAITKRGVIVVRADTRVQAYALNNGLCIQSLHLRIGIQLIEVADAQRQIGIGEKLHRLRLLHAHKEHRNVYLDCALLQQLRKGMRSRIQESLIS